jgi:DNA-binding transcriptional LysR family regulator
MDARLLPDMVVFLEVVKAGSLTKAAQRLHTVQSNVTARMKILEQAIGMPLLRRHARGVRPTAAGEAALAMALRAHAVVDELRSTFGKGGQGTVQRLRLGAIETVAATHLPRLVASFVRRHPHVDVSVHAGSSSALIKQLKDGELDVAFVSQRPRVAGCRQRVAFRDELVLVAPPASPSLATLLARGEPALKVLVQRLGCSYTERLLALLHERGRERRLLEIGTLEGILRFVEAGVGVAVMPRAFVESVAGGRRVAMLALPPAVRRLETCVLTLDGERTPVVDRFVATIGDARRPRRR